VIADERNEMKRKEKLLHLFSKAGIVGCTLIELSFIHWKTYCSILSIIVLHSYAQPMYNEIPPLKEILFHRFSTFFSKTILLCQMDER
jgi:hypothetical protein